MRRALFVIAALALALSACELRAEISVENDGSGTVGMVFLVEPEMLRAFEQPGFGGDPFADLRADLADDPVTWSVADAAEGNLRGIRATFAFASVGDLREKMEALASDQGSDGALSDVTLERRGDGWAFEGSSGSPEEQLGGELPIPVDQLATLLKVQFRVTLPGAAGDHNADEVSTSEGRTTFVWKPDLRSDAVALRASTTPGGAGLPMLPIALGLAALAVAAIVLMRRSTTTTDFEPVPAEDVEAWASTSTADGRAGERTEDASIRG